MFSFRVAFCSQGTCAQYATGPPSETWPASPATCGISCNSACRRELLPLPAAPTTTQSCPGDAFKETFWSLKPTARVACGCTAMPSSIELASLSSSTPALDTSTSVPAAPERHWKQALEMSMWPERLEAEAEGPMAAWPAASSSSATSLAAPTPLAGPPSIRNPCSRVNVAIISARPFTPSKSMPKGWRMRFNSERAVKTVAGVKFLGSATKSTNTIPNPTKTGIIIMEVIDKACTCACHWTACTSVERSFATLSPNAAFHAQLFSPLMPEIASFMVAARLSLQSECGTNAFLCKAPSLPLRGTARSRMTRPTNAAGPTFTMRRTEDVTMNAGASHSQCRAMTLMGMRSQSAARSVRIWPDLVCTRPS
mmetsp:Transcript_30637/g.84501  ORF Transcript_30637/g.84501 Transcript_30637/m.84501 type:complete len:368 (+) Transcript_30637:3264-4367(+)